MIKIVQCQKEEYDYYCGRPSVYGNPYIIGPDGNRNQVIEKYRTYFLDKIKRDKDFEKEVLKLKDSIISCWCDYPKEDCHCRIIKEYLENNMKKYRVGVVGSRNFNNKDFIFGYLDSKIEKISHLVSGGCPTGADSISQIYAKERGMSITVHYPNWEKDGKGAGFKRNHKIVEDSDIIVAFTTGSKGTQNTIDLAKKMNKQVIIHEVEPDLVINYETNI